MRKKEWMQGLLGIFCVLAILFSIYAIAKYYAQEKTRESLAGKVLRFHVLAASDSEEDQRRKLLVRDGVGVFLQEQLADATDRSECEQVILEKQDQIQELAEQILAEDGMPEQVKVELGDVEFPVKEYGEYEFPAGTYRALQIIIGDGAGHNWWCVLYPNLCFQADGYGFTGDAARAEMSALLSPAEYEQILKEHRYRLGFKYLFRKDP